MTVDYLIVVVTLLLVAGLSAAHALPGALLLVIFGVSSLTDPLSAAGARSLFPTLVPVHLWERANALDNGSWVLASVVGAPLAGTLVGFAGGEWALAITAAVYLCAAVAMATISDPSPTHTGGPVLREAWSGLTYVFRNRWSASLSRSLPSTWAGGP